MSLVEIVTLDDTWSDIHATLAVLNPLKGWRHPGDAMAIITYVTTLHESLDHTVNYVWHILERMVPPNACPFQTFLRAIRRRRPRILETSSRHGQSWKGRSRHQQMTAGTPSRRASTGTDARPPYEGRSRPPVTPQNLGAVKGLQLCF
jgi:hypothetical protein